MEEEGKGSEGNSKMQRERGRERTGSVGVLDLWKRKRELEEGGVMGQGMFEKDSEPFRRSKKTPRSPEKKEEGLMIMGVIKKWMEEMNDKWVKMEERMNDKIAMLMGELENWRKGEEKWRGEREGMEKRISDLEKKWERGQDYGGSEKKIEEIEKRMSRLECEGGVKEGMRRGELEITERMSRMEKM